MTGCPPAASYDLYHAFSRGEISPRAYGELLVRLPALREASLALLEQKIIAGEYVFAFQLWELLEKVLDMIGDESRERIMRAVWKRPEFSGGAFAVLSRMGSVGCAVGLADRWLQKWIRRERRLLWAGEAAAILTDWEREKSEIDKLDENMGLIKGDGVIVAEYLRDLRKNCQQSFWESHRSTWAFMERCEKQYINVSQGSTNLSDDQELELMAGCYLDNVDGPGSLTGAALSFEDDYHACCCAKEIVAFCVKGQVSGSEEEAKQALTLLCAMLLKYRTDEEMSTILWRAWLRLLGQADKASKLSFYTCLVPCILWHSQLLPKSPDREADQSVVFLSEQVMAQSLLALNKADSLPARFAAATLLLYCHPRTVVTKDVLIAMHLLPGELAAVGLERAAEVFQLLEGQSKRESDREGISE